ncbi:hypothetical protein E4T56_gene14615 [Termitomyces sp. T112]|nr:hypothetical protein E4T56_gene14615 [Termitomyces sp. T112]
MGVEQSKGCGSKGSINQGDIGEAGPSTPKGGVGGIAKGLVTLPGVVTILKNKGKGQGKAREEEEEEFEEPIEDNFTDKHLAVLLCWQKVLMVVDMEMGAGVVLGKAKGKSTALLAKQQAFTQEQGMRTTKKAADTQQGPSLAIAATITGRTIYTAGKKETEDVEMREKTPLATIAEVEPAVSRGEVEGKEEVEAEVIDVDEDEDEEGKDEERIR